MSCTIDGAVDAAIVLRVALLLAPRSVSATVTDVATLDDRQASVTPEQLGHLDHDCVPHLHALIRPLPHQGDVEGVVNKTPDVFLALLVDEPRHHGPDPRGEGVEGAGHVHVHRGSVRDEEPRGVAAPQLLPAQEDGAKSGIVPAHTNIFVIAIIAIAPFYSHTTDHTLKEDARVVPVELWQQLALQTLLEPGQGAGGEAEVDLGGPPRHAGVGVTSEALQLV